MNGLSLTVDIADAVGPRLSAFVDGLENRQGLNERIADRERNLVRDYFDELSATRHDTANRLGAEPSGFWDQARDGASSMATEEEAVVSITKAGIGRAGHDVTITPGPGKQFLTIPLIAEAYNKRAYTVPGLFALREKAEEGKSSLVLFKKEEDGTITPWYALVRSVTQLQDRTMLPSDEALLNEAIAGVRDYIDQLIARKEAA
jgi:hypothetical protein